MKKDPRISSHIPDTPLLQAEHLTVAYEAGVGLEDVSFQLSAGERVAVVGPNGAGKSTLFKIIAGVIRPDRGSLRIYGSEPGRHTCIAYLAQHQQVDWNFPVTVEDVVMMGRTRRIGFMGWPGSRDRHIVKHALETVGLEELSGRQISQLSGGQQQRMFIARALALEAELVLMDEPVTGLDTPSQEELFKVLDLLREQHVTVMLALHDLKLAAARFEQVLLLNHRLVAIGTPAEVMREKVLRQAYGEKLQVIEHDNEVDIFDDSCCGEEEHTHA